MLEYNSLERLPTAEELPSSDDTPVDNELQNLLPNLLLASLAIIWPERMDWYFGVDMGIYYIPNLRYQEPLVPDGFLSVGVERRKRQRGRLSYVLWEENYVVPLMALECVSHKYGGEYDEKQQKYVNLGVLYYVVYNPEYWQRDKHQPFEVYRLTNGEYVLQSGEPFYMPEIGLGIGRGVGTYCGWRQEWLYWYDETGFRHPSPDEATSEQRQRAEQTQIQLEQAQTQLQQTLTQLEQEQLRAQRLAERLRARGIDPSEFLDEP